MQLTRSKPRTAQLREIHSLARQAGLETNPAKDRSDYEALLFGVTGLRSARQMSRLDRERVISHLEARLGTRRPARVYEVVSDDEALEVLGLL